MPHPQALTWGPFVLTQYWIFCPAFKMKEIIAMQPKGVCAQNSVPLSSSDLQSLFLVLRTMERAGQGERTLSLTLLQSAEPRGFLHSTSFSVPLTGNINLPPTVRTSLTLRMPGFPNCGL